MNDLKACMKLELKVFIAPKFNISYTGIYKPLTFKAKAEH